MTDKRYAVIFRGDIVMGQALLEVKQRLKQLFKVDDARIDNLFKGKPVPLKNNITRDEAEKYQLILRKAGALVAIEPVEWMNPATTITAAPAPKAASVVERAPLSSSQWRLAPVGSRLSDRSRAPLLTSIASLTHLTLAPQQGNLLQDNERPAAPLADIDIDSLDWDLTPLGEALLRETEKTTAQAASVDPNTLNWSLSAIGEALLTAAETAREPAVAIDISGLSLAEVGGNLLAPGEKKQPSYIEIDTSHLHLQDEGKG